MFFFNIGDQFQFGQEYTISNILFLRKDELSKTKFIDSQYHDIDSRSFLVELITLFDIVESIVEYIVEDFSCIFSLKSFGHVLLLILSNG